MKTLEQIIRYTSQCKFANDDWQKVLDYCREQFGGGKIHKSTLQKSESTYEQFLSWIDSGFGSCDLISYGNTMGVIGDSTPESTNLIAYCDYDGKLIVKDMNVKNPNRLKHLDEERSKELRKMIYDKGLYIVQRFARLEKLYTPQRNYYVTLGDVESGDLCIGIYLESEGCSHHFSALLNAKGKLEMDCWVSVKCTLFKPANDKDIRRLHQATSDAGWSFNGRTCTFIKMPKRGHNNVYWYMNDRFEIVLDRDNGSRKHTDRYEAGNYFTDNTEAVLFMKEVKDIRKGGSE